MRIPEIGMDQCVLDSWKVKKEGAWKGTGKKGKVSVPRDDNLDCEQHEK